MRIPSPNRQNFVSVRYSKVAASDGGSFLSVSLRVNRKNGTSFEIQPRGLVEGELLWSPDSSSFLVNSSDGGEGPQFVQIYQVNEAEIDPGESSVIAAAQQDMLEHFPPCRAKDADPEDCAWLASHGEAVNVAAVDWTRGSSAIVVMAEMPCSSRFGSIMCQVLGYELEASTGKILRRMEARQFAREWQRSMAWKFQVPEPPEYEDKK